MEEIKIRVWDKEENRMISGDRFAFEEYAPLNDLFRNNSKKFDFMLYTGYKDINGKEIYEGDIIERTDKTPVAGLYNEKEIGVVEYKNAQFVLKTGQDSYYEISYDGIFFTHMADYKVIGNIYENKELLEGK